MNKAFQPLFRMVGKDGFEPSKPEATDLQSVAFDHSATFPEHLRKKIINDFCFIMIHLGKLRIYLQCKQIQYNNYFRFHLI